MGWRDILWVTLVSESVSQWVRERVTYRDATQKITDQRVNKEKRKGIGIGVKELIGYREAPKKEIHISKHMNVTLKETQRILFFRSAVNEWNQKTAHTHILKQTFHINCVVIRLIIKNFTR